MHERCAACELLFEREPGYFVGAIYVNYAFAIVFGCGAVLLFDWLVGLSLAQQLTLAVLLVTAIPLLLFRHARSCWLALDYLVTAFDERHAPRRS